MQQLPGTVYVLFLADTPILRKVLAYVSLIKVFGRKYGILVLLSLIHISEPTRQAEISYAVFCLKKKKNKMKKKSQIMLIQIAHNNTLGQ